jgi:hypothetical protein
LKTRIVGVARQQLHFLWSDKESEAKESSALRWACLARYRGNLNSEYSNCSIAYTSPAGSETLVSLSCCGGLQRLSYFVAFPCKAHGKVRPFVTGPDPHHSRFLISQKPGQGDALRKEKAFLHTFVAGQKYGVGRDATRRLFFWFSKYRSKQSGAQYHRVLCPQT